MKRALAVALLGCAGCADWAALAAAARCKQSPASCDGGASGSATWPDSSTVFCTDGSTMGGATCPSPGQALYGQDGNYRLGVASYERQGDVIHDSVTGLDWESASGQIPSTQAAAVQRCALLQTGGFTWRLPSRLELASLLDFGGPAAFPGIATGPHWSASAGETGVWSVDFLDDTQYAFAPSESFFSLCVTGPPLTGATRLEGEVLFDSLTGLTWERTPDAQGAPWSQALARCEALTLAEATDWRLPSAKELLTLVRDDQQEVPDLGSATGKFWTSSPTPFAPQNSRTIELPRGTLGSDSGTIPLDVRCVRGP
jgi:hypothetical protein